MGFGDLKNKIRTRYPVCNVCKSSLTYYSNLIRCDKCVNTSFLNKMYYFELSINLDELLFSININNYNIHIIKKFNDNISIIYINESGDRMICDNHILSEDKDFDIILTEEEIISFIDNLIFI